MSLYEAVAPFQLSLPVQVAVMVVSPSTFGQGRLIVLPRPIVATFVFEEVNVHCMASI